VSVCEVMPLEAAPAVACGRTMTVQINAVGTLGASKKRYMNQYQRQPFKNID